MAKQLTQLSVFIATPGGLAEERAAFRDVIRDYNESDAMARGVIFTAVGWEDTLAGVGRPQSLINEDVRASDYFLLLLWDRWGSPPDTGDNPPYSSGTEEEWHEALCSLADNKLPMRRAVLMFKGVEPKQLTDPGPQLTKVLDFKKVIEQEKEHLYHTFDSLEEFGKTLRKHLAAWLREEESGGGRGFPDPLPPDDSPVLDISDAATAPVPPGNPAIERAWELANAGKNTEAEVEFANALMVGRTAISPLNYASFLRRLGRFDHSEGMLELARQIANAQDDEPSLAAYYGNLGILMNTRGDLDGAEEMHRKSLEIEEAHGRLEGMASDYGNLGNVLGARGDLDGAEEMYRKSLEIEEKLGRQEGVANVYGNLGVIFATRGDLDGAEEMHRMALAIDERLGRQENMANGYGNLGNLMNTRGDLDGAEEMHRKSLEIEEALGRLEGMAADYGNLGNVLSARGDLDGAEEMYQKTLEIEEKLGRQEGMANGYGNLGTIFATRGDLDGAEEMYRKALAIDERLGRQEGRAYGYGNLGNVFRRRGDLDGAEEMYEKSLEVSESFGGLGSVANAYFNLGIVLMARGDLDGAKEMYQKALELARRLGLRPLVSSVEERLDQLKENDTDSNR